MAIPTDGGGSEVLKRNSINNLSTSNTGIDWSQAVQTTAGTNSGNAVPANVIITILTVTFCNRGSAAREIIMRIDRAVSHSAILIIQEQALGIGETFIFSDKLVLRENDTLQFIANGASVDVHLNYIYQDWS